MYDGVLICNLHHTDTCLIFIRDSRIWIYVFENLLMEHLLELDHTLVGIIHSIFIFRQEMGILYPVDSAELTGDVQLEIHIYTVFLKLCYEIVEFFELHGLDEGIKNRISVFRSSVTDIMHADNIDTISGKFLHQPVCCTMFREAAGHSALSTDETDFITVTIHKMISFRRNESVRAGNIAADSIPSTHISYIVGAL